MSEGRDAPSLRESLKRKVIAPPFTKKTAGKHYVWACDLLVAHQFSLDYGLDLVLATADYQVAKLIGEDVKLVIYPHTTKGTRNQHLRVRDEGSKNKTRAQALMVLLNRAAGFNCTFSYRWTVNSLAHQWQLAQFEPGVLMAVQAAASPGDRKDGSSHNPPQPSDGEKG